MDSQDIAVVNKLHMLDSIDTPCWLHRPEPGKPYCNVIWANQAARERFGPPLTQEQRVSMVDAYPESVRKLTKGIMQGLHENCVVKGYKMSHRVDPRVAIQQVFTDISQDETMVNLSDRPFPLIVDGQAITVCISQITDTFESLSPASIWAALLQTETPIHSYLFDQTGHLQFANLQALNKWHLAGDGIRQFTLQQLLTHDGEEQPELAAGALKAICQDQEKLHRLTLRSQNSEGKSSYTQYDMWPVLDLVPGRARHVVLVNTLDVTHQRQLELHLEAAKDQLQRQNVILEASKTKLEADQAKLKSQQAALKARLQQALQMTTIPKTNIDTVTVADKAVHLLDLMIEGDAPELEEMVAVRNAMVRETDLRQPMDLGRQLLHSSGLADDVGEAMVNLLQGDSHTSAKQVAKAHRNALTRGTTMHLSQAHPRLFSGSRQLSHDISQRLFASLSRGDSFATSAPREDLSNQGSQASFVDTSIIPHVETLLQEAADSWTFSIFDLSDATSRPLSTLGFFLLKGTGLMDAFQLEEEVFARFLREIEDGYVDNPYHSATHAAGVLQVTHMLVQNGLIQSGVLDDNLQLSCYLAAICHDHAHPGLTNDFLIKTRHRTALVYNDISPLESMHVSTSFQKMYDTPGAFFVEHVPRDARDVLRASIIELILGTDMKKHFSTLSRFQAILPPKQSTFNPSCSTSLPLADPSASPRDDLPLSGLAPEQKLLVAQVRRSRKHVLTFFKKMKPLHTVQPAVHGLTAHL